MCEWHLSILKRNIRRNSFTHLHSHPGYLTVYNTKLCNLRLWRSDRSLWATAPLSSRFGRYCWWVLVLFHWKHSIRQSRSWMISYLNENIENSVALIIIYNLGHLNSLKKWQGRLLFNYLIFDNYDNWRQDNFEKNMNITQF